MPADAYDYSKGDWQAKCSRPLKLSTDLTPPRLFDRVGSQLRFVD